MESVVFEDSPLAAYLEGDGEEDPLRNLSRNHDASSSSSPSPSFAPQGKPKVRLKIRNNLPPPLRLNIPHNNAVATIHNTYSKAINSRLGRADNARFLEHFRYTIVASQLLNTQSYLGQVCQSRATVTSSTVQGQVGPFTLVGSAVTASIGFALAWLVHWTRNGVDLVIGIGRMAIFLAILAGGSLVLHAYIWRQWLHSLRQETLSKTSDLVVQAQHFDHVVGSALSLVQEVELVSRGYKISTPLPPISRLEDRSQIRRCTRLRKTLRLCFADVIPRYNQACTALKPLTEQLDLEKFFDVYDINDLDFSEAMLGYSDTEFEDPDSLRVLKILAARFQTTRKIFLCCLMALDANGGKSDFPRWRTAVDEIHELTIVASAAEELLRRILGEEESFPVPPTPKLPLTPNRERWRAQLRKLNSLSSGIRGLQAKLHVLRDESDRNLNDTDDVSELGTNLMIQYESIGIDLKALMQEWETGKAALASNIDRNERRVSSMSGILSPTTSLSGLTAVEEGNATDALRALNGEPKSRSSMEFSSSDAEEIFEAIAVPRQRSALTREERIAKMKEDRVKRESTREKAEANTHMLRELESVINMRPRGKTTSQGRIATI